MCLLCLVQLLQAIALSCAFAIHTHARTHSTRNRKASAVHLPETLQPTPIEFLKKHFLVILPCPPFHLRALWSYCITLNRPVKRRGGGGVGGRHAYRCFASGQHTTSHDDNHNDDDDKDDDSEECCL